MLDRTTERLLELFADTPQVRLTLGPPTFNVPDDVADRLGLHACESCGHAIVPAAHGRIRWHGTELHPTCAYDELLALATAA